MSEAGDLLEVCSEKLEEAIVLLQEAQEQIRLAKMNLWRLRKEILVDEEYRDNCPS